MKYTIKTKSKNMIFIYKKMELCVYKFNKFMVLISYTTLLDTPTFNITVF